MIECEVTYAIDGISRLIKSGYKSMECKQDTLDKYQEMIFKMMDKCVFRGDGCFAWYLNDKRVNWTLWPGDLTYYWWKTRKCSLDDYHVR